jgi:hypothetical protein
LPGFVEQAFHRGGRRRSYADIDGRWRAGSSEPGADCSVAIALALRARAEAVVRGGAEVCEARPRLRVAQIETAPELFEPAAELDDVFAAAASRCRARLVLHRRGLVGDLRVARMHVIESVHRRGGHQRRDDGHSAGADAQDPVADRIAEILGMLGRDEDEPAEEARAARVESRQRCLAIDLRIEPVPHRPVHSQVRAPAQHQRARPSRALHGQAHKVWQCWVRRGTRRADRDAR